MTGTPAQLLVEIAEDRGDPPAADALRQSEERIQAAMADSIAGAPLAAPPVVTIRPNGSGRPIVVSVDGRELPFPAGLLARVARAVDPGAPPPSRTPDGAAGLPVVERLVVERLRMTPSALLPAADTPDAPASASEADVTAVTGWLLDHGVDPGGMAVDACVELVAGAGGTVREAREAAFARGRSSAITAFASASVLELGEDELATAAAAAVAHVATRYGAPCGRVDWVSEPDLPPGTFALRVNQRLGLPIAVPEAGEGYVQAPPERLIGFGATSARLLTGARELAASVVDTADAEALRAQGLPVEEPADAVAHLVETELQRRVDDLIDVSDIENRLARLAARYPVVSRLAAVLGAVPLVTEVLRALGREGVRAPALPLIVRIALEQLVEDGDSGERTGAGEPARVLAEVRRRLARELTSQASLDTGRLGVLVVNGEPASREDGSSVRASAWSHWADAIGQGLPVAVVTPDADRAAVRHALEAELPELSVLAAGELTPDVELIQLGELTVGPA